MRRISLTNKIIIVSVLAFIVAQFLPADFVNDNLFYSFSSILAGNVYVVVTALFMHGSLIHLVSNMMLLYLVGNALEEVVGSKKFALVFFLGGVSSFILSSPFYASNDLLVGSSGAIFTVMAVVAIVNPLVYRTSRPYKIVFGDKAVIESEVSGDVFDKKNFLLSVFVLIFLQLTISNLVYPALVTSSQVSDIGHLTGFLIGLVFGIAWSKKLQEVVRDSGKVFLIAAVVFIVFLYSSYALLRIVNPTSTNFLDDFLSGFNIKLFLSEGEKCNNYCLDSNYDYGSLENQVCTCGSNLALRDVIK